VNKKEYFTTFGKEEIPVSEKLKRVQAVFDSVVNRYDLMNDLMSLGAHRLWKKYAVELLDLNGDQVVLDLAAGTGDISKLIGQKMSKNSILLSCDSNFRMLSRGRDKMTDSGIVENVNFAGASAESLPFSDNSLSRIIVGFGLRNFSDKKKSLEEMYRVLQIGGKIIILEFSKVENKMMSKIYDFYSFNVLPFLGEVVTKDRSSYQYLVDSIRNHPDQISLKNLVETIGFENSDYFNILSGIVAIHVAYKT